MAIDKINATALLDGGVSTADIADDAITTAKIANSQVTDGKIAAVAASKLTGALPAISGANLTGISDTSKAPIANPTFTGTVSKSGSSSGTSKVFTTSNTADENWIYIGSSQTHFRTQGDSANRLTLTDDGRGLSQFTAKAWITFNGQNTISITDSHNISSIVDSGTGQYRMNFQNNLANANYCIQTHDHSWGNGWSDGPTTSYYSIKRRNQADAAYMDVAVIWSLVFGD